MPRLLIWTWKAVSVPGVMKAGPERTLMARSFSYCVPKDMLSMYASMSCIGSDDVNVKRNMTVWFAYCGKLMAMSW